MFSTVRALGHTTIGFQKKMMALCAFFIICFIDIFMFTSIIFVAFLQYGARLWLRATLRFIAVNNHAQPCQFITMVSEGEKSDAHNKVLCWR